MQTAQRLQLGVIVSLRGDVDEPLARVQELGLPTCQIGAGVDVTTREHALALRRAADARGVTITTIWARLPGRHVWDFIEGPITIGLVPEATRAERLAALKQAADFAYAAGVPSITTHVGFIPEDPNDPKYAGTIAALKEIAAHCQQLSLRFWFETGQETPVTLLRTIEDVGTDNLGINLDPANLLMYGKANPVDALDIIGRFVEGVHAKDGEYPTNGRKLGQEKPLGEGRVNFPVLVAKLKGLGFKGALTIEREITGPRQIEDIKHAIRVLTPLL
jgi:L-ribulose-5-phosphate 3-epimerase